MRNLDSKLSFLRGRKANKRATQNTVVLLVAVCFVVMLLAASIGSVTIPFEFYRLFVTGQEYQAVHQTILFEIRLPRVILAAGVGFILATCGALAQGLFRNPLADPSLIGVSAGASVGGSLMIVLVQPLIGASLGGAWLSISCVSVGAFLGGLLSVLFVYRCAKSAAGVSVPTMLLLGVALAALAGSTTSLLSFFSTDQQLRQISLWHMGGLGHVGWVHVAMVLTMVLILACVLPRFAQPLNAFLLGESQARYMGINVAVFSRWLIVCVALGVGITVAMVGPVAFLGLVVPHFVRLFTGANHQRLLPVVGLVGAILFVIADALARNILAPVELPTGLVTALIGAPVFIYLLVRNQRLQGPL